MIDVKTKDIGASDIIEADETRRLSDLTTVLGGAVCVG